MPEACPIFESTEPTLLPQLGRCEGPLWHPGGYVTLEIHREGTFVGIERVGSGSAENTGGNGCTLDRRASHHVKAPTTGNTD
jgi:hypothetical protein